jgi:hypothetical protein
MESTTPQPRAWPAWLAVGVAAYSLYQLPPYIREAVHLLRYRLGFEEYFYLYGETASLAAGLLLFVVSAGLICLRRPLGAWVGVLGFLIYLSVHFYEWGRMAPVLPLFGLPELIDSIGVFWPMFLTATLSLTALLLAAYGRPAVVSAPTTDFAHLLQSAQTVRPAVASADPMASAPREPVRAAATHEAEVALVLYGEGVSSAVIAQVIGLQPTTAPRHGESAPDELAWRLSCGRVISESVDFAEMASDLVAKLAAHASRIRQAKQTLNLQATLEIDLRLSTDPSVWPPDGGLTAEVIQFLGQIGAEVEFEIYRDVDDPDA